MKMLRAVLGCVAIAILATACADTTSKVVDRGTPGSTSTSPVGTASSSCPPEGCPVPDCGDDIVAHANFDPGLDAVGVQDVSADVERWADELVGGGDETGLPGPQNMLGYLVVRDGRELALLRYTADGQGGWLRSGYTACQSALR
jgi:hypothetical protein